MTAGTSQFVPCQLGRHLYAIEAWTDQFATWRHGFELKLNAGQDVSLDALEGAELLSRTAASDQVGAVIQRQCQLFLESGDYQALLAPELMAAMALAQPRPDLDPLARAAADGGPAARPRRRLV
ncbi:MAG: DUF3416 domain-containing protein [Rhodopseudomonas palustris]|nr:DUF3416 domain-containing protein [Rhodopseudomonas palustris]